MAAPTVMIVLTNVVASIVIIHATKTMLFATSIIATSVPVVAVILALEEKYK